MFAKFLPKEVNFFDLFDKQAASVVAAARFFKEIISKGTFNEESLSKMKQFEHKGDEGAYEIINQLNKTFITPFDREDIHSLAKELDDIIDMIYTIVNRLKVYKLSSIDQNLVEFSSVIEQSALLVERAVKGLRSKKNITDILECCKEINRLENVGDSLRDKVLAGLFENGKDPVAIIKWKEVYEDAETVLDICEDVAHVVEAIVVKQA